MINYTKIKNMNIEQMAEFLQGVLHNEQWKFEDESINDAGVTCHNSILDWLQTEYEVES